MIQEGMLSHSSRDRKKYAILPLDTLVEGLKCCDFKIQR
jgi:hypothetical protein